jgi:hypothetical protein
MTFDRSGPDMLAARCGMTLLALALVLASLVLTPSRGSAQDAIPPNPKISIDYIEPRLVKSVVTYELLKKRGVLEELSQFLSPLQLPVTLRLRTKSCGVNNAYYDPREWAISLCYEFYENLEAIAPRDKSKEGYTRYEVVVGGLIDALFHELGHALFDIYGVPVFGREEDAADQISAFVMLQFGPEVAMTTIRGAAFTYLNMANPRTRTEFADEHGTATQRFFNYICLAYGGHPDVFKEYVDSGILPKNRAAHCTLEYQQVRRAFGQTILPHVDQELMKRVQARKWVRPTDGLH